MSAMTARQRRLYESSWVSVTFELYTHMRKQFSQLPCAERVAEACGSPGLASGPTGLSHASANTIVPMP